MAILQNIRYFFGGEFTYIYTDALLNLNIYLRSDLGLAEGSPEEQTIIRFHFLRDVDSSL